ncbi:hypothetical protein Avbf_17089, partial [Armadillidium vulgare]
HFNSYAVEALDNYYVCSSADIINTDELGLYKCYEGNKNYHLITLKYLPAECKSVENILEKEQSVYPDARIMATYNNKHISFQINDSVTLSGFHDIIKKNSEISPTQRSLNSLYLMTTLKNMFCWLTWQQFRTYKKSKLKRRYLKLFSSSWICKFTLPDFGIVTNKLSRSLAVTRSDETTIVRSIFTEVQKFTLYPKSSEYTIITKCLLSKYPSLGKNFEAEVAEELWKGKIIAHFQNHRHRHLKTLPVVQQRMLTKKRKNGPMDETLMSPPNKRSAVWGLTNYLPGRELGENDCTIREHTEFLQLEFKKLRPNYDRVNSSMTATLSDRRHKIVVDHSPIAEVIETWPWLKDENEVNNSRFS